MTSKRSLRPIMHMTWIAQAPKWKISISRVGKKDVLGSREWEPRVQDCYCLLKFSPTNEPPEASSPFALTQSAFTFGNADWSLMCSIDSGGSWYIRLLERLLLLFLPSFIFFSPADLSEGAGLVLGVKASVRGTSREDRFAVLLGFEWSAWQAYTGGEGLCSWQNVCRCCS